MGPLKTQKHLLWWGRFDPEYSRNRILRNILQESGYKIADFRPRISPLGGFESRFAKLLKPDAVWVPSFRQRDYWSAKKYAERCRIPLIFDPLISAWDKAVFERKKFPETDRKSLKLLAWEQSMFSTADLVIADTSAHADLFIHILNAPAGKTHVVPVGAEELVFTSQPYTPSDRPEVLFFGSFIQLQAPEIIVEAARMVPAAKWTMLGNGPLLQKCRDTASGIPNIAFEDWIAYEKLPLRIGNADILLGIFGTSPKAGRVIPNKAYQALACARPLVTRHSEAYPAGIVEHTDTGVTFVPPGDPVVLAEAVSNLIESELDLSQRCQHARQSYDNWFSEEHVKEGLLSALASLQL